MKNQGPNKQKYYNQRREKTKIASKEGITYIVQLLREKYEVFSFFLIFLVLFEASTCSS